MPGSHCEVLVVGCGIAGSAVSYNLARRGVDVLCLERYGLNHDLGSSHGRTRIIRLAYFEDPRYVPLLRRAYKSWRELESASGRELLRTTGGLMMGRPEGELVSGVLKSAEVHGLAHKLFSAGETQDLFPAFTLEEDMVAVYEKDAGVLFAEDCVESFVEVAAANGCRFRFTEPVVSWRSGAGAVEVETPSGRYSAEKVVFCGGGWNAHLVPGVVPLRCERQVPFWFSSRGNRNFTPEKMPVFIFEEGTQSYFYGIPDLGQGVKVARHHGGETCEPDEVRRGILGDDLGPVNDFVARRLRPLTGPPTSSMTCIYTNTPDYNFALGNLPSDARVTLVSACSGHGFKFASVLGEVVADLVTTGKTGFDISFLGLERFGHH